MYKIILYKDAVKFYEKVSGALRIKINLSIDTIAKNPYHNIHIKKLRGELSHMYRYRVGDARILYEIHEDIKTVRIKSIESRCSVYK